MISECFPSQPLDISNVTQSFTEPMVMINLTLPIITSFSSLISFKVNKTQHKSSSLFAEVILKNGAPLWVKTPFKMIFMKQLQSICRSKLTEINHNYFDGRKNQQKSTEQYYISFQNQQTCFHFKLVDDKNGIKIEFSQIQLMMQQNRLYDDEFIKSFFTFLKQINYPLVQLLQRIGTLKPSFSQKLKSNRQIQFSKKTFKKILKEQEKPEQQTAFQSEVPLLNSSPTGVFEQLNVVREQKLDENELSFKRGGYFNIIKRKLIVYKSNDLNSNYQCKIIAQKKLSRRKRPNTIYNYEGKIPKELKFLELLNNLSLYELKHFAQYYVFDHPNRRELQQAEMMDEQIQTKKDTLSTMSEQHSVSLVADIIYMNYYQENLQEYMSRKGRLDILQILQISKQIFQSVQILHKVGIVHRDIKPANFMVERLFHGAIKTKLIDFGQSTLMSSIFNNSQILGFSTQYAPIQCTYSCKQGYNSKQIDLWSIGVIIYKLITNRMPVTYSKCFKSDIKYEWPTSLSFFINQYSQGRWSILYNMVLCLSMMLMRVKPQQRMSIRKGLIILEQIRKMADKYSCQFSILNQ